MIHLLPELPYPEDALEPWLSRDALDYHYARHHAACVGKVNALIRDTGFEPLSLETLVRHSAGLRGAPAALFNNAAESWNHAFYWQCLTPTPVRPAPELVDALRGRFGSVADFREQFTRAALSGFGSGWVWLAITPQDTLEIVNTCNGNTPLTEGQVPLLGCDIWEHAYYLDYRNVRARYLAGFWRFVNWDFVADGFRRNSRALHAA